jgi:hypothetical protein
MNFKKSLLIICATSLLWGCVNSKEDKEKEEIEENKNSEEEDNDQKFDITKLLVNVADNIIIPQLDDLKSSTEKIESSYSDFTASPSAENLINLRSSYKESYLNWQSCSFINFGSSSSDLLGYILNTFPVNEDNIIKFFNTSGDNVELSEYYDSRGYPGFDYVLFEGPEENLEDNQEYIINRLNGIGKDYFISNSSMIKLYSTNNYNFWKDNKNNYYQEFTTDDSKTQTSPLTKIVNAFCQDLEVLKNEQLKAPGGQEFFTFPVPSQSEALYSGYSLDLFKAHLANLERIYKGEDLSGTNGVGFDDYLVTLGTMRGDDYLNDLILSTFNTIEEKVDLLNGSINEAAKYQKDIVDELYSNVKKLVGYTKTDMTYAFGININYADPQDGD